MIDINKIKELTMLNRKNNENFNKDMVFIEEEITKKTKNGSSVAYINLDNLKSELIGRLIKQLQDDGFILMYRDARDDPDDGYYTQLVISW